MSTLDNPTECYDLFEQTIARRVSSNLLPLFTTDIAQGALWGHFLSGIDEERRQHYNCNSCKRFIEAYGGLVILDKDGKLKSLLWASLESIPHFFQQSVQLLNQLISNANVTGVFLSSDKTWGIPQNKDPKNSCVWTHLHAFNGKVFKETSLTAEQVIADKKQDYQMICHALADYNGDTTSQAVRVLKSDTLPGSEKALAVAEWFHALQHSNKNQRWLAVATAPSGFAHVRSTIISTLLDDIKSGLQFDEISRKWSEKMHPLQYRRPTAAPKEGAIEAAEKLVEKLGVAKSLDRCFATLDDVAVKLWTPSSEATKPDDSVFGHLKQPESKTKQLELPSVKISWEKFNRTVLHSECSKLEVMVPRIGGFYGLVTGTNKDAPNILQWDNPVSWYFYHGGSLATRWGLTYGWKEVSAVFLGPHKWTDARANNHHGEIAFFSLPGCEDTDVSNSGLALFPQILKSEFHGISSVIEAHSKKNKLTGTGNANGMAYQKGDKTVLSLRVDGIANYAIDRWD